MSDALRREVYRKPRPHEVGQPRRGDLAEIIKSHCVQQTGLILEVVHDPHLCVSRCADCGLRIEEWMVEVWTREPSWHKTPGPWFYPLAWLKRIDPRDPFQFERVKRYEQLAATPKQWIDAST
jgi:hypothetical protein